MSSLKCLQKYPAIVQRIDRAEKTMMDSGGGGEVGGGVGTMECGWQGRELAIIIGEWFQ